METMRTVSEMPEFLRAAKGILTENERFDLISSLALNPAQGEDLGSGIRKMRFGRKGAYRVVHWWHGTIDIEGVIPVVILTMFRKSGQANLTPDQQRRLRELGSAMTKAASEKLKKVKR